MCAMTHPDVWQHTATRCDTMQHTAIHCNTLQQQKPILTFQITGRITRQRMTTHDRSDISVTRRNTLQQHCSALQQHCSSSTAPLMTSLYNATHCNTLQQHCNNSSTVRRLFGRPHPATIATAAATPVAAANAPPTAVHEPHDAQPTGMCVR